MMAESFITPDQQGSSKPKNINSQRSRRNIQRTFHPLSINSLGENHPPFYIIEIEEISSRQINRYSLIKVVPITDYRLTIAKNNLPL